MRHDNPHEPDDAASRAESPCEEGEQCHVAAALHTRIDTDLCRQFFTEEEHIERA